MSGLRPAEIAKQVGISRVQAYALLSGEVVPRLDTAISLAKMLSLSIDELIHPSPPPTTT